MTRSLLVVSYEHPPCPGIGGTRWLAVARHLRDLGHSVTIVASDAWGDLSDDSEWPVVRVSDLRAARPLRKVFRRGRLRTEGFAGLERPPTALLTKVLVPEMNVATWLPALSFTLRRLLTKRHFDCLVTTSPPESSHLGGLLAGDRRPAWLADFRDGWTFEPYRESFPTEAQRRLDLWLERRVCEEADLLVAATRPIANDLRRRVRTPVEWVTNGWIPAAEPRPEAAAAGTTGSEPMTLVYTGTLSAPWGRDPGPLLSALARIRREPGPRPLRLVHAGRLTTEERALIDRSGAADLVEHLGTLDRTETIALQRSADALVLITSRNSSEATGKLFEYLASGRPILALAEGSEAARIILETQTGITVPPDDPDAIFGALRRVASGELSRAYAPQNLELYTYPGTAERMAGVIEEAIRRHAGGR